MYVFCLEENTIYLASILSNIYRTTYILTCYIAIYNTVDTINKRLCIDCLHVVYQFFWHLWKKCKTDCHLDCSLVWLSCCHACTCSIYRSHRWFVFLPCWTLRVVLERHCWDLCRFKHIEWYTKPNKRASKAVSPFLQLNELT